MLDYRCCVSGNGFEVVKLNLPPNRYWECIVLDSLPLRGLIDLDGLEEKRPLSIPETNFRIILKAHILKLLDFKKQYW